MPPMMGTTPPRDSRMQTPQSQTKVSLLAMSDVIIPPKVYRYNCKGVFSLRHDQFGSAGVCHGIQSRLERIEAMVPPTAVSSPRSNVPFQQRHKDTHGLFRDLTKKNQDKENLARSDMIQQYNDWSSHSLVYGELELQAMTSIKKKQQDPLKKEMLAWLHSFGSTNVHVLVAPRSFFGTANKIMTVETVLGVQANCHRGIVLSNKATSQERERGTLAAALCGGLPLLSCGMRLSYEPEELQQTQRRTEPRKRCQATDNKERDTTTTLQEGVAQFSKASSKVLVHMKKNAENVFHDFPNRVIHSGQRITGEFEKNLGRTGRLMGSVVRLWFGDNHDKEEPENGTQRGRSRHQRGDCDDGY